MAYQPPSSTGGEHAPLLARRTSSTRLSTSPHPPDALGISPTLSISSQSSRQHSPWANPPSPITENVNYFSTLPPSPPRSSPPSPPPSSAPTYIPSSAHHFTNHNLVNLPQDSYPTPPGSVPGSAKLGGAFNNGGVTVLVDHASPVRGGVATTQGTQQWPQSSYSHGSQDASRGYNNGVGGNFLSADDKARALKKRPSLILTTAPHDDGYSHVDQNGDPALGPAAPLPSPRMRRAYPTDPSTATAPLPPSPALPPSPYLSTSPVNSPTLANFPYLSTNSPTLGSVASATMERVPSSPRLSTVTDNLGRLATGLVRRASNNSLKSELPTSVVRSPSPGRAPPSPTLSAGSLSPLLGGGGAVRRGSFAAQAREKEKEREMESKKDDEKKRVAGHHNRMFSWAERPGDLVGGKARKTSGKGISLKRKVLLGVVALVVVYVVWHSKSSSSSRGGGSGSRAAPRASQVEHDSVGSRLRRTSDGGGVNFIHPDVISPPPPRTNNRLTAPFRWLRNLLVIDSPTLPSSYHPATIFRSKKTKSEAATKAKKIFNAAPHVEFADSHPLPPPPVHSDAPARDTLILYRILGNDLPPRHSPGQTLRNLRFLLQYESDFSILPHLGPHSKHHAHAYGSGSQARKMHSDEGGLRVDKYFVLNRIADPEMVSAIIGLLHLYSVPNSRILIIPFEWKEYQRREFRWDSGVDLAAGWGIGDSPFEPATPYIEAAAVKADEESGEHHWDLDEEVRHEKEQRQKKRDRLARLRALDFTYHEKNLYAMNNNGGRNFALQHGRSLPNARWILPLDGNSFFTPAAMYSIVRTLSISGEGDSASRYVIIPMARLLNNEDVRINNTVALVPRNTDHEGGSATDDAETNHRPAAAPDTPDEPQIGFRYDSTESFQEAMRYGRRSKLELLWRLGAIPYSRALDRRTLPWEFADRAHITAKTWGSIPGVEGTNMDSIVHQPHGDFQPWVDKDDPPRGPLAFAKAGWVYRLFSGYKSQEEVNSEAVTLRNTNRIKGIVAFLERLDEKIARGQEGCFGEESLTNCGFTPDRLWNFDQVEVEKLRQGFRSRRPEAVEKIKEYERQIAHTIEDIKTFDHDIAGIATIDAGAASNHAVLLAMAAYLTGNSSYAAVARDFIATRFVIQTPLFYRQGDQRQSAVKYSNGEDVAMVESEMDAAYAFPPVPTEPGQTPLWNAEIGARVSQPDVPQLPFDPLEFDPSLLLDAIRLLSSPNAPESVGISITSRKAITPMFSAHLAYLLYHPHALHHSRVPDTPDDGAHYDSKIASLAAFLDDAKLLGRVANRARLRLPAWMRAEGLMDDAQEVREIHFRLMQGLSNVKLRPWSLLADPLSQAMYVEHHYGSDQPLPLKPLEMLAL